MSDIFNEEVKVEVTDEIKAEDSVSEIPEIPSDEKKEEKKEKKQKKPVKKESSDFINRKLKVINNMTNPAKARSLAERVLNNRK